MKTTIRVFLLGVLSLVLCMCKPINPPEMGIDADKELLCVLFNTLSNTPAQYVDSMLGLGYYEAFLYEEPDLKYHSFVNIKPNSKHDYDDDILSSISWNGDTITKIGYSRYLNKFESPSDYYAQISDFIAAYGYTDWQGYYAEDEESDVLIINFIQGGDLNEDLCNQFNINKTTNRDEYLNHLTNNKNFSNYDIQQGYVETFTYTHNDNSKWSGRIGLYTTTYTYGIDPEDGFITTKDIKFNFSLTRIQ